MSVNRVKGAPVPRNATAEQDKNTLRSVGRALDLLEILGSAEGAGLNVGEIAKQAGISKSTAFLVLQTLVARQFVADIRSGTSRVYRLGPALAHLSRLIPVDLNIGQIAAPFLDELMQQTNLTTRLAVLDDGYAVTISQVDPPGPFRMTASLGQRELPHCSSLGKALLIQTTDQDVKAIAKRVGLPRRTSKTITNIKDLIADLHQTRQRGYAIDDEEDNDGVICLGAPVYDHQQKIVAAISVTGMKQTQIGKKLDGVAKIVTLTAQRLSAQLGFARQ